MKQSQKLTREKLIEFALLFKKADAAGHVNFRTRIGDGVYYIGCGEHLIYIESDSLQIVYGSQDMVAEVGQKDVNYPELQAFFDYVKRRYEEQARSEKKLVKFIENLRNEGGEE